MIEIWILGVSVFLQFMAAILAVRLIWITKQRTAWLLIVAAILLMAARRSITLYNTFYNGERPPLMGETIAFATSLLMLLGIILISPLFSSIKKAEAELQWLIESMINAFVLFKSVFDENGKFISYRFVYINDAYERITGVKNDEVRGKTVHEVWPETEPEWIERYGSVAVTGKPQEFDLYHDPTKKLYHCNAYRPWETQDRFCVIFEDITERKFAKEAFEESEKRLQLTITSANLGTWDWDIPSGKAVYNQRWAEMLGYPLDELKPNVETWRNLIHPEDRRHVEQQLQAHFRNENPSYHAEFRMKTKDGRWLWVLSSGAVMVRDPDGKPLRMTGTHQDITDRKEADEALKKQEEILNQTGTMAKIGGWEHDLITGEGIWTKALYDIVELDSPPPPGPNEHLSYYPEKEREILRKGYQKAIETGEPFDLELQVRTAKGRLIWCRAMGMPIYDAAGNCVKMRGTFQDITDRKTAEIELAEHRQHLEELVEQRTAELKRTVNLMAGREVRMAELKKDIYKLREQLTGAGIRPIVEEIKENKPQEQDAESDDE